MKTNQAEKNIKQIYRYPVLLFLFLCVLLLSGGTALAGQKISLSAKKKTVYIETGKSAGLGVKASPKASLTYKSSDASIVKVTKKGKVKALKPGKATVTVKAKKKGYKSASLKIRVYVLASQEIIGTLDNSLYVDIEKGSEYTLSLTAKTALTCKSSKPSVVKVLSGGRLKGLKPGKAVVTVTAKQSKQYAEATKEIYVTVRKKSSLKEGISYDGGWTYTFAYCYRGATYHCGELPLSVERSLAAKYVPLLKDYLQTYMPKEKAVCADHTLAVLAAIRDTFVKYKLSYNATPANNWSTYHTARVPRDEWYSIATTGSGLCEDFTSLFAYMCYLEGVDCWIVGGDGHAENMLVYQGHYYIIEPQDYQYPYDDGDGARRFYMPVIGKPTSPTGASKYTSPFKEKVCYTGITTEAAFRQLFPQTAVNGKTPLIAMVEYGEVYGAPAGTHVLTLPYQFYLDCEAADKAGDFYGNIWYNYDNRVWEKYGN